MAAILLTPSIFYVDLIEKEDYIIEIINCCYSILSEISTDLINLGIDSITVKDSLASPSMISPDLYRKFAFPYEKKLVEHIQKKIPVILHICQNSKPILLDMVQTGASVLEIDYPVDLLSAVSIIKNKATIKGNLNASLLECDTIDNIEKIVREKICIAQDASFILSTGDSVSPLTPDINLRHIVEVVKKGMY
jgi:uroporphyrinogen-III decarboxylase